VEDELADDLAGPIIMQLVPLSVAAPVDSMDLAPGPLMEEAKQSTESAQEIKPVEDMPPVEESPLAPEPEVVLPTGKPTEVVEARDKPEEEQVATEAPIQTEAAPATTAPPRVDAEPNPSPSAAASGSARKSAESDPTWQKALMAHLGKFRRYPADARSNGTTGTATVTFVMDQSGKVLQSKLLKSSGSPSLDEEAVAVLQRASPLPQFPGPLPSAAIELNLPIQFRLR
jgi:protein TonB